MFAEADEVLDTGHICLQGDCLHLVQSPLLEPLNLVAGERVVGVSNRLTVLMDSSFIPRTYRRQLAILTHLPSLIGLAQRGTGTVGRFVVDESPRGHLD